MELWLLQGLINRRANGTLVRNTEVGAIVDGGGFARGRWMAAMADGEFSDLVPAEEEPLRLLLGLLSGGRFAQHLSGKHDIWALPNRFQKP
ncbi:hypothetical protein U1Q18_022962 [Sarracenia purpurea var. burkii]